MADLRKKKIVYLFGAGATHAELCTLFDPSEAKFQKEKGLLIKYVSDRVIGKARKNKKYLRDIGMVSSPTGSLNIELLISLIESSRIRESAWKTSFLKELVRIDIERILEKATVKKFYLHKALLELHHHEITRTKEEVIGLVSLNYDNVLDEAYKAIYNITPNYSFSLRNSDQVGKIPLLKLHGSFGWSNIKINGKMRNLEIIPLGANKNYLHVPYNFIWSRALELLIECDILRVIGCSLNQNDIHLIDLIFKAHLEKVKEFEIQIIGPESQGEMIQQNYGFLPNIKRLTQIEPPLVADHNSANAFATWLGYKGRRMLKESIQNTRFLTQLLT
jgi:hypothetical protein